MKLDLCYNLFISLFAYKKQIGGPFCVFVVWFSLARVFFYFFFLLWYLGEGGEEGVRWVGLLIF